MNAEKLTQKSAEAIRSAQEIALEYGNPQIEQVHLLWALLQDSEGLIPQLLAGMGVTVPSLQAAVKDLLARQPRVSNSGHEAGKIYISGDTEKALNRAEKVAGEMKDEYTSVEHLFLGLLDTAGRELAQLFSQYQITRERALQALSGVRGNQRVTSDNPEETYGALKKYGSDLVERARQNKLDPVIGRDDEIRNVIRILSRKSKNNPVLIGEPGVGKTAIAEGLAQRIVKGDVPENLRDRTIFSLDMGSLVAGAKFRGEFEERMKGLIAEVEARGNVILFLDEIHTMIGAGGAEGAIDASSILKPSLARGELQLIGATTLTEYRKYIEKDAALERRFQPVSVEEPTKEECREILLGLKEKYEVHHKVEIRPDAIDAAVQMSERYVTDRNLPDKAIDVLDEACSKVSLKGYKVPDNLTALEEAVKELASQKEESIKAGDFDGAAAIQKKQEETEARLEAVKKRFRKKSDSTRPAVTENDIADVVSAWTKIPVQKLGESDAERLKKLETVLHRRVIGQEEAVSAVARAVRRGRVGLKDPRRPVGSFLFLGPTGVGKTELSKALADALFGSDEAMIRVDMSEYMEKHSVSKLIGSPPGYVGYEEGGQLSDRVRTHPYSVILFDEIEKAHPDVFNILLQVLDDGHITDSQGRKVDFSNTVIIMTSNAGAKAIVEPKKLGFSAKEDPEGDYKRMKQNVMDEVKQIFRPEFLNRIDEIIVFHALDRKHMKRIVSLMCRDLTKRLLDQMDIRLTLRESAKNLIVDKGADAKYGARPLRRALQTELEDRLAEAILNGAVKSGDHVEAGAAKKEIRFIVK